MVAFFLSCIQNQKISCPRVDRINQISRPSKLPRLDRRRGEQMPFFFNFLEGQKEGEGRGNTRVKALKRGKPIFASSRDEEAGCR